MADRGAAAARRHPDRAGELGRAVQGRRVGGCGCSDSLMELPAGGRCRNAMLRALETTWQDVRYGLRALWRDPSFSLTALLAATLGIGAATAVFSAVDRSLFRPLPDANEERLGAVGLLAPRETTAVLLAGAYVGLRRDP